MRPRTLTAELNCSAEELISRLGDDHAFPTHAPDVLSVDDVGEGARRWVIAFRGGTARWVQSTAPAPDDTTPHRIAFTQVEGDFQELAGSWSAVDRPDGGCTAVYSVRYRTSVPHLAGAIDSAVGRVLVRSAYAVLAGIAGPARLLSGEHHLRDLPQSPPSEGAPDHEVR